MDSLGDEDAGIMWHLVRYERKADIIYALCIFLVLPMGQEFNDRFEAYCGIAKQHVPLS